MVRIDFNHDQNTMRRVTCNSIYTLRIKIRIKENISNFVIFIIIQETLSKFGG